MHYFDLNLYDYRNLANSSVDDARRLRLINRQGNSILMATREGTQMVFILIPNGNKGRNPNGFYIDS